MSRVSERAADSAEVARKSVSIAHKGGETVRQTIAGMETIREQIQETSKRIKRLGESSQEIGDIVNLITEISDQTNILALNAAIQASMAGEAGRGFAVVADEVQRLAERTGDATKQIEALVKTIQADTNEATVSMEQSTANVVKGAKLTENAGSALDRIEQVSMNLAQRILEISDATRDQAQDSVHHRDHGPDPGDHGQDRAGLDAGFAGDRRTVRHGQGDAEIGRRLQAARQQHRREHDGTDPRGPRRARD